MDNKGNDPSDRSAFNAQGNVPNTEIQEPASEGQVNIDIVSRNPSTRSQACSPIPEIDENGMVIPKVDSPRMSEGGQCQMEMTELGGGGIHTDPITISASHPRKTPSTTHPATIHTATPIVTLTDSSPNMHTRSQPDISTPAEFSRPRQSSLAPSLGVYEPRRYSRSHTISGAQLTASEYRSTARLRYSQEENMPSQEDFAFRPIRRPSALLEAPPSQQGGSDLRRLRQSMRRTRREVSNAKAKVQNKAGNFFSKFLPASLFYFRPASAQASLGSSKQPREIKVNFPKIQEHPHRLAMQHKRHYSVSSQASIRSPGDSRRRQSIVDRLHDPFPTNGVTTAKYTNFTFVPINLYEQFRRFANVFFLLLVVIQFFPEIQTVDPLVPLLPLLLVVGVTAAKDGFEDYKRRQLDRQVNGRLALVLHGGSYKNENHNDDDNHGGLYNSVKKRLSYMSESNGSKSTKGFWKALNEGWTNLFDWVEDVTRRKKEHPDAKVAMRSSEQKLSSVARKPAFSSLRATDLTTVQETSDETEEDTIHSPVPTSYAPVGGLTTRMLTESPGGATSQGTRSAALTQLSRRNTGSTEPISPHGRRRGTRPLSESNAASLFRNDSQNAEPHLNTRSPTPSAQRQASFSNKADPKNPIWKEAKWQDIRVGDIVYLQDNEFIPADVLILSTSEPEGICFIETKNLDGETNLKVRKSVAREICELRSAQDFAEKLSCKVSAEVPNSNLYSLNGSVEFHLKAEDDGVSWRDNSLRVKDTPISESVSITVRDSPKSPLRSPRMPRRKSSKQASATTNVPSREETIRWKKKFCPVTLESTLLRGAVLRNTEFAIGIVLYTGSDTKLRMNAGATPLKQSLVDRKMNPQVMWNLALLFVICAVTAVAHGFWNQRYGTMNAPFVSFFSNPEVTDEDGQIDSSKFLYEAFLATWTGLVAFQNLVPVSLYLTIELVKGLNAYFIWKDVKLYYAPADQPAVAKAWNLADDLGQIQYIFSDKTGTLTQNVMELRKCSIGPRVYGEEANQQLKLPTKVADKVRDLKSKSRFIIDPSALPGEGLEGSQCSAASALRVARHLEDPTIFIDYARQGRQMKLIREFFRALALCHTVLVLEEELPNERKQISYRAQSPDEAALVEAAKDLGFAFVDRKNTELIIDVFGETEVYELLGVLEFNSDRKRMSVIVRSSQTGEITMYCKGADSVILERLTELTEVESEAIVPMSPAAAQVVNHPDMLDSMNWSINSAVAYRGGMPGPAEAVPPVPAIPSTFVTVEDDVSSTSQSEHQEGRTLVPPQLSTLLRASDIPEITESGDTPLHDDDMSFGGVSSDHEGVVGINDASRQPRTPDWRHCTLQFLEQFADDGLRTLCVGSRKLSEAEFEHWHSVNEVATRAIEDRQSQLDAAADLVEKDLTLLGSTAIEDKLQDGVPTSLKMLRLSGIKVWVLTGDKVETAISIGYSCNLITPSMTLIVIRANGPITRFEDAEKRGPQNDIEQQLVDALREFTDYLPSDSIGKDDDIDAPAVVQAKRLRNFDASKHTPELALVLDGEALKYALGPSSKHWLLELGCRCSAVLCCRVSPLQKAQVVELVRNNLKAMTLAIGDGANDVSMIQAAHIGVGIAGEEGLQAVTAADYAVGQFRFLQRLLFVHGRWAYHRLSEMIYNFFFKNIIWVMVLFWYQIYCGWSTVYVYDFSYMTLFNIVFTGAPVIVMGIFDKDVHAEYAENVPYLYKSGMNRTLHTKRRFIWYMMEGIYQSLICFFIPLSAYVASDGSASSVTPWGYVPSRLDMGTTMGIAAVANANIFAGVNLIEWTLATHLGIWLSILSFPLWVFIGHWFVGVDIYGMVPLVFGSVNFYLSIIAATIFCQLPRLSIHYLAANYGPTDTQIIREVQKGYGRIKDPVLLSALADRRAREARGELTDLDIDTSDISSVFSSDEEDEESSIGSQADSEGHSPKASADGSALSMVRRMLHKTHSVSSMNIANLSQRRPRVRRMITLMRRGRAHQEPFLGYSFSQDESRGLRSLLLGQNNQQRGLPAPAKNSSSIFNLKEKLMNRSSSRQPATAAPSQKVEPNTSEESNSTGDQEQRLERVVTTEESHNTNSND